MKFAIICSKKDLAGKNIFKQLKKYPKLNCHLIEEDSIHAENLHEKPEIREKDFVIFASKHASKEKRKTLSIHAPGNFGKAEFGGKEGKLCPTSALFLKHLFQVLNKHAKKENIDYEVTLEATHHGPYIEKPCCFIEIGSSLSEWQDEKAGEVIAGTIEKAVGSFDFKEAERKWKSAVLLGGGHYNQAGNKIILRTAYAIGHICPKYMLQYLNKNLINQTINKTTPIPEVVLLDWKGLGKYKKKIVDLLEKTNLKYERVQNILKRN